MKELGKLVIPSDLEKLVEVDAFAEKVVEKLPFSADQRDDIAISLSEAVNNAILHGNGGDTSKNVTITLTKLADGLKITVQDEGTGFMPDEVKDPTDPENLLSESGRGLLIIRHLMDDVTVTPTGKGTTVELTKRFEGAS